MTEQTGGRHFAIQNLGELPDVAEKIGLELRNEYVLGYRPHIRRARWEVSQGGSEIGQSR
ncbi:MAG: hypothetical protein WDO18_10790 [Acidobacteriota bacterium]